MDPKINTFVRSIEVENCYVEFFFDNKLSILYIILIKIKKR